MLCNRSEAFCREITLNSHYLVLFKNPWDKLQILTLVKLMYPNETAWFIKEYEEAVRRPYGYLFVDLKPTTPDKCRLRTNVLPGEEGFDKGFEENRISQELLQYLRQETLMMPPRISEMQRIQNNMDNLLYRTNLEEDQKAKQYMQLHNKFLNYKNQLKLYYNIRGPMLVRDRYVSMKHIKCHCQRKPGRTKR